MITSNDQEKILFKINRPFSKTVTITTAKEW